MQNIRMEVKALAVALALTATPAIAQQAKFVPFTIDEQTYQQMLTFLGEVPSKYANPIINALAQKEQRTEPVPDPDDLSGVHPDQWEAHADKQKLLRKMNLVPGKKTR